MSCMSAIEWFYILILITHGHEKNEGAGVNAEETIQQRADDPNKLFEIIKTKQPDVVITDIVMPQMDAVTAVKHIVELYPQTAVIGLSLIGDDDLRVEILKAGAFGYLLKNAEKEEILKTINCATNGVRFYSRCILDQWKKLITKSQLCLSDEKKPACFNDIEQQIISLICQEKTSKQIGELLHYSIRTIEGYRTKIMDRMQVKTTTGIVVYAIKNKLCKI